MSSRCLKDHVRIAARRQKEGEHKGQGQIAVSAVGGSGDGDRLTAPLLIIAGFSDHSEPRTQICLTAHDDDLRIALGACSLFSCKLRGIAGSIGVHLQLGRYNNENEYPARVVRRLLQALRGCQEGPGWKWALQRAMPPSDVRINTTDYAWTEIDAEDGHRFLYGPRFGRLYLLPVEQATDSRLLRVVGLSQANRTQVLTDPATRVLHNQFSLSSERDLKCPRRLAFLYRFFHATRSIVPFVAMASLARRAVPLLCEHAVAAGSTTSEIGTIVHVVERKLGWANCYPRALLTAGLATAAGRACTLVIGQLAPTRKMHAWCSVDGEIPYEPSPEHYLYQPLWMLTLRPEARR